MSQNLKLEIMTTLKNTTGTKAVNIIIDCNKEIIALYVQIYNSEEQVLQMKSFSSQINAEKWANKILK